MKVFFYKTSFFTVLSGILLAICACGGHTPAESSSRGQGMEDIPRTPEEIVHRYQAYVDSNLFDLAQSLSTPRSAPLHQMMASIVADTPSDSSLIHTQFINLDCAEKQDTVICTCLLKDEYEEYSSEYILVKVDGRWLVDLPEEKGDFELFEQESMEEWPEKE